MIIFGMNLVVSYRTRSEGNCRLVIRNKSTGEIYETIYIRIVPANTVLYKDEKMNNFVSNPGSATVDTETNVEFQAFLMGPLLMDGDVPSASF